MPITDKDGWKKCEEINTDLYGGACVKVARRVMELLDEEPGPFECHNLICRADDDTGVGSITGFMAGCVAQMVSEFHSRGEEFRRQWNIDNQINDEGEKANDSGGILNPALLTLSEKKK